MLVSTSELVAIFLTSYVIEQGRRSLIAAMFGLAGASLFLLQLTEQWKFTKLFFASVARGSLFAAGGVSWIFTPELHSTEVRATATGLAFGMARIGGAMSSYIIYNGLYQWFKVLVLIGVACGGSLLCSSIPHETAGKHMVETNSAAVAECDLDETRALVNKSVASAPPL